MPYIKQDRRRQFAEGLKILEDDITRPQFTPGDLNYLISRLIHSYVASWNKTTYTTLNDVMGVLECAKAEFYRKVVVPYEEKKIKENGDL